MPSSFVHNFVKPINSASFKDNENSRNELITAYTQSLDLTLHQAVEAEREAEWWDDVEKSSWKVYFYLIQCKLNSAYINYSTDHIVALPSRLHNTLKIVASTDDKVAAAKPSFLIACCFPHLRETQSQTVSFRSKLRLLYLLPYHYTRQEIALKRRELLRIRDEQARALGSLVLLRTPVLKLYEQDTQSSDETSHLSQRLHQSIDPSSNIADVASLSSHTLTSSQKTHRDSLRGLSRPSWLVRTWPLLVFGPPFALYSIYYLYASRGTLIDFFRESKDVAKGFVLDWCIKPLAGVLDTVKASKGDEPGLFISKEGVQADYDVRIVLFSPNIHLTHCHLVSRTHVPFPCH